MKVEVEHLVSLEEISWVQKLRVLWLKEGDNNTKFFHHMVNLHRRYNHLRIYPSQPCSLPSQPPLEDLSPPLRIVKTDFSLDDNEEACLSQLNTSPREERSLLPNICVNWIKNGG